MEARLAALKVYFTTGYAAAAEAIAAPAASPQERTARQMAVTAEVACVLTVSERSAAALLAEAATLTSGLPLTLSALRAGTLSWQHARVMCDETSGLEPSAAAALEAHFLDPEAPFAARGCPAGELVPARFKAKARSWRERHHPVSMEARHRKGVADRRLDFAPDRDGMAWISAYLPADTASGVWARATEAARALQGPSESRTLTQLRADVAATWLLAGVAEGTPSPAAQVLVTVPVLTLAGTGDEPALLDGYGPIPREHGPPAGRRRCPIVPAGADRSAYRSTAGNRTHQLPDSEGNAPMAPASGRSVPIPRLQQPVPGQRGGPSPGVVGRRWHRHCQPWPALPEAPPPQTHHTVEAGGCHPGQATRLDLTRGTHLPQRTTGLGTRTLAGPFGR